MALGYVGVVGSGNLKKVTPGPLVARCHTTIPARPESYMWECSRVRCPGQEMIGGSEAVRRGLKTGSLFNTNAYVVP